MFDYKIHPKVYTERKISKKYLKNKKYFLGTNSVFIYTDRKSVV